MTGEAMAAVSEEPRRWERTAQLAEAGWPTEDIAEWMGVHTNTIYRRLQEMGCSRPRGPQPGSVYRAAVSARRAAIRARWENGENIARIGQSLGITRQRVSQILHKAGIRGETKRHDCERCHCDQIRRLREEGMSWGAIDRIIGTGQHARLTRMHPEMARPARHCCQPSCRPILDGYAAGKGTGRLAAELGLFQSRVYLVLRYHGVTLRPRGYMKGQPRIRYAVMEVAG